MRIIVLSVLAVFPPCLAAGPAPADAKMNEPTAEQLAAAQEAYGKFGARYYDSKEFDPGAEQSFRFFHFPLKTDDDTIRNLPNLPFSFGLDLSASQVTDTGFVKDR